jgi:HEPN domain-containing protein
MKKIIVPIFLLSLLYPVLALSQGRQNIDDENGRFHQVYQQLDVAKDLLNAFPDRQAEEWIKQAEQLLREASNLLEGRQGSLAMAKINAANTLLQKAINELSITPLERLQDQVEELIRRAEQTVAGRGSKEAERLIKSARENRNQGMMAFRDNNYRKSMEHYRVAKSLLEKALNIVQGPRGDINEQIETEKNRFEELSTRAEKAASTCQQENARRLLQQARQQYQNTREAVNRGDFKFALSLYYNATRLLLRVIDICEGRYISDRDQMTEELEMLGELLAAAQQQATSGPGQRNTMLFNRANRLYHEAEESIRQGKYVIARRQIDLARNLTSRMWRGGGRINIRGRAYQELERLKTDVKRFSSDNQVSAAPHARALLQAAQRSVKDAEEYLQLGRTGLALQAILAGNRFISALQAPTSDNPRANLAKLSEGLDRLKSEIESLQSDEQLDADAKELLDAAGLMASHAKQALEDNELELAGEYIKLGFNIVQKSKE